MNPGDVAAAAEGTRLTAPTRRCAVDPTRLIVRLRLIPLIFGLEAVLRRVHERILAALQHAVDACTSA
jgi:hypothetical protein